MAFLDNIFSFINMRSFSSVWFWIVLALYWSSVSQTVLGAPYDVILRAKRDMAQDKDDLDRLVYIHLRRRLEMMRRAGHWVVAFAATLLTAIFILAFSYRVEFAQALFVLIMPITLVRLAGLRMCFRIEREGLQGVRLARVLLKHRFWMQVLGVIAIFVTAVWGMLHVMSRSALGL
ncbi:MAG: component of SufBCD complex [Roseinatronobacter sp.]|nr:component of SufBCD complex [Roseinatronobacter sp.]